MTDLTLQIRRCAKINSAVFDIVYADMCENDDVRSIHAIVLASCVDQAGEMKLSPWVPAPLVSHVHQDEHLWYVNLSLTPAAMKYFTHAHEHLSFECRIGGVVTQVDFPTDQLIHLNGLNGKDLIDTHAFQYLMREESEFYPEEPTPEPENVTPLRKRPSLSVVKND